MNVYRISLALALLLSSIPSTSFSQPSILSVKLSGLPQTIYDTAHPYAGLSASPGADVFLTVTASGPGPLGYQWRFNQTDLLGETGTSLQFPYLDLTNAGDYTVVVTNSSGSVTSQVARLTVDSTFTKISTGPVITDPAFSEGGAWADYDNDGFPDLFVVSGQGTALLPFLYRNNGNGTFTKITTGAPVNVAADATSACWGDYENNGNLDLFVATTGNHLLYHNSGDSTFTRILTGPVVTDTANSLGSTWVDYDQDGLLDLFVTVQDANANAHNLLYRNNGDGIFTAMSYGPLVTDVGSAIGCGFADYDNDGHPDLFVCGGRGPGTPAAPNRLYHNNGNGTFTRISAGAIATDVGHCGACAWGDYDNDGYPDLFVGNSFSAQNLLYHNNGDGTFTRILEGVVATDVGNCFGCAWGDYDNDGFLDLFVSNEGDPSIVPTTVNYLYHNNGDGTFSRVMTGSPANEYSDSLGCSWVDYDNDGSLDLFAARGDGRGNFLYHNRGNTNGWLTIKLVGTVSNRSGVGAKVRVQSYYRGASRWQLRQITGGTGWGSQQELRAHFGLGDSTNVDLVRIEWPSGIVQTISNVAPRQSLTVVEHQETAPTPHPPSFADVKHSSHGAVTLSVSGDAGLLYLFEGSTNLVNWSWLGVRSNATGTVQFNDTSSLKFDRRFYRVSAP